ncbi:MAG: twin-arginine translocase subunit TatC, partial [Candidatus Thermoplasmatota archaeon]
GFQARVADVGGVSIPYPYPDPLQPLASQFFNMTLNFLKPAFVVSTVLNPADAFIVQFKTAFFLALLVGMPVVAYQMGMFIAPGLRPREKRTILKLLGPSMVLFALGVLIAFFVVLPFTFDFLYQVAVNLGVDQPMLHIDQFLDFVLLFMLGFGLAFQVPVVMYALTAVGLVRAATWKKYWRIAIIAIFGFGAIITPDGSGVTMILVSGPMSALYVAGYAACVLHERRRTRRGSAPS